MDSEESPLDVLSRAATMVSPPTYDESRTSSNKEMPCAKWRRDRRQAISNKVVDAPLDFSTRSASLKPPPSYDQSIQSKTSRPSVIQSISAVSPLTRTAVTICDPQITTKSTPTEDVCDPAIDEHFRRSLGKDYCSIFSKDDKQFNKSEDFESDSLGLTVDDHFAKALGDTWIKLKEKENEDKVSSAIISNNNHLVHVKDLSSRQTEVIAKKKKKSSKESVLINDKRRVAVNDWVKT